MADRSSSNRFGIIGSIVGGTWWAIKGFMVLILTILFYVVFISLLTINKTQVKVPDGGALLVNPKGLVVEQLTEVDRLAQFLQLGGTTEASVYDIVRAIDLAAADERISMLVLNLDYTAIPWAYASKGYKIAEAVDRFKESGKEVYAYGLGYEQGSYLVASHADEIYIDPFGGAFFQGYETGGTYMKSFYDKIMITNHQFSVGKFKSYYETYFRDDMSEASRTSMEALLSDMWGEFTGHVEAQRGLPTGKVQDLGDHLSDYMAETGGDMAEMALQNGLVDKLMGAGEWRDMMSEKLGEDPVSGGYKQIDYLSYLSAEDASPKKAKAKSNVAVVVAKGTIVMGEAPRGTAGGDTIARLIRQARESKDTKAIVLRVDSPGGSAFASEVIRRELVAAKAQGIPVVASMGSMATSGGYWISASSDRILAEPTTITGSIGVAGMTQTFEKLGDWAGVHGDGVGTTTLAGYSNPWRPINEEFAKIVQLQTENTYSRFINLVSEGRDMTPEAVHEIAQGRVWSAPDALDLGLVDEIGDLSAAVAAAAELAGVEAYKVDFFEKEVSPWDEFYQEFQRNLGVTLGVEAKQPAPTPMQEIYGEVARQLRPLTTLNDPNDIYLICEVCPVP